MMDLFGGRKMFGFLIILVMCFVLVLVKNFQTAKDFADLMIAPFGIYVLGNVGADFAEKK